MASGKLLRPSGILRSFSDDQIDPITTNEAITKWEEKEGKVARRAKEVMLDGFYPPISLMDGSISLLVMCEKLSLSTNMIERIGNLSALKNLKILSLSRNLIKTLLPLETVSGTLEELWISYNQIEKFDGLLNMKKLRVLYISHNLVKDWLEFRRLAAIRTLEDLVFNGNPLQEDWTINHEDSWTEAVQKHLKSLRKLDGVFLARDIDIDF